MKDACPEIHGVPTESESLALAKSERKGHGEKRPKTVGPRHREQGPSLHRVKRPDFVFHNAWGLDERGDVAADDAPPKRLRKR